MTAHDVAGKLPGIPDLRKLCQSIAMAEAVLNRGDYRYYSFGAGWTEAEEVFSMRDGSGGEFDVVFSPAGACLRGFDHESPMSPYADDTVWPGVLDHVPEVFRSCVEGPAFTDDGIPRVTFCLWREPGDDRWHTGRIDFPDDHADPDGSGWMLRCLVDPTPDAFRSFAEDYYERTVDLEAVRHIYDQGPLTRDVVARLNPDVTLSDVVETAKAIGYPA
ncbi:hypothetical protein [Streptomyces sp. NPDC003023]|uniref:hypothetical protein n=1 Tax=Streptomyces sp. NPDC003023 TaxID=3364675 RepID=UPI00367526E3